MKRRYALAAVLLLSLLLLVKNAWLSDDAYITFRTVDNLAAGHGPVYNIGERVQSYTHPLWMFLLSGFYLASGEHYFTTIIFSIVLTLAAVYVLFRSTTPTGSALFAIGILLASKAFVDYSTSGLENPLSHVLLALFLVVFFRSGGERRVFLLGLVAATAALNRLDALLVYLPMLGLAAWRSGWKRALPSLLAGLSPLVAWTVFSLIYYGAPVANPAYAKLASGIPRALLAEQAFYYYVDSLSEDPVTLVVIFTACALAVSGRRPKEIAVAAGIGLYLVYIVWIGGDFMSGRFFALPLLTAAVVLPRAVARFSQKKYAIAAYATVGVLALFSAGSHLFSGRYFGDVGLVPTQEFGSLPLSLINEHGICDERAFYYQSTGLLRPYGGPLPDHPWVTQGQDVSRSGEPVKVAYALGLLGYYAGPGIHVIDSNGLSDYFIARLPASGESWRIGHFARRIPEGYTETLASGSNVIPDPNLAGYYDAVELIVRGDLFAQGRLAAIWRMNRGGYNHLIAGYGAPATAP